MNSNNYLKNIILKTNILFSSSGLGITNFLLYPQCEIGNSIRIHAIKWYKGDIIMNYLCILRKIYIVWKHCQLSTTFWVIPTEEKVQFVAISLLNYLNHKIQQKMLIKTIEG